MSDEGLEPVPDDLSFGQTIRGFAAGQKLFGRYVLDRIIGRGGMGLVWLAADEKLEQWVALKFLPETLRLDTSALDDLKRETRRGLSLAHPHIVRIYDFVDDDSAAAISMEFVDGRTLSALRTELPARVYETANLHEWMTQLTEALDYAHRRAKIVHRDLKPANLMTTLAGDLKVADFGIARSISDSVSRVSVRGASSGTLVYMSPQQAQGLPPKPSDDIYAMGATLYELLTSKPPFFSGNIQHQLDSITAPPMAERRAELEIEGEEIPAEWEQTVAACLAKDPADRPQSIAQMGEWLGLRPPTTVSIPATQTLPATQKTTRQPAAPPAAPAGNKTMLIGLGIGALALVLLLGGGLGYYFGVMVPAEKARQDLAAKQEADAKAAAEQQARLEQEKQDALVKAQQEADARAAAAEQAAKDAQAAADKARQAQMDQAAAVTPVPTPPPAPPPAVAAPVITPGQIAHEKEVATQVQALIDAKKPGAALYELQLLTNTMDKDRAAAATAPFQDALGAYQQQRDAAIAASQNGDPAAALGPLQDFARQNPDDPKIQMAIASVETRMPPSHNVLRDQLKQFQQLSTQNATVGKDPEFLALQNKFTAELKQLDALAHRLDELKSSPKGHGNLARLEAERTDAQKKLASYQLIQPGSLLYLTVASSIADKQREINSLTEQINEIKQQPVVGDGAVDDAQQKYDDFIAAVPW